MIIPCSQGITLKSKKIAMDNLDNLLSRMENEKIPAKYVADLESNANRTGIKKPDRNTVKAVRKLAFLGLDDKEICKFLGINPHTFGTWKRNKKFMEALTRGRVMSSAEVAHALYKRAVGWSHEDVHVVVVKGEVREIPITKHYAPDVAAAQFILKNKTKNLEQPWSDVSRTEITGKDGGAIKLSLSDLDTSGMSLEELLILKKLVPQVKAEELTEEDYDEFEMVMDDEPISVKEPQFQRTK